MVDFVIVEWKPRERITIDMEQECVKSFPKTENKIEEMSQN